MSGWNAETAGPIGAGSVTLVEGSSFCISLPNGDIRSKSPHGLFFQDNRPLSAWILTVNGQTLDALAAKNQQAYRAIFLGRVAGSDGYSDGVLLAERVREVGAGMLEEVTIRNYSPAAVECVIALPSKLISPICLR